MLPQFSEWFSEQIATYKLHCGMINSLIRFQKGKPADAFLWKKH